MSSAGAARSWRPPRQAEPASLEAEARVFGYVSLTTGVWWPEETRSRAVAPEGPSVFHVLESVGGPAGWTQEAAPFDGGPAPPPVAIAAGGARVWQRAPRARFVRDLRVTFDLDRIRDNPLAPRDAERLFAPTRLSADPDLRRIVELLHDCHDPRRDGLYADILALALLQHLARLAEAPPPRTMRRGGLAPWQAARALAYLREHLVDGNLASLSDEVGLSPSYLVRAFKTSFGVSPHRWLREARIARAQERLLEPQAPLAQIALETGFSDQAHLTNVFRQFTGETPAAWRRRRSGPS